MAKIRNCLRCYAENQSMQILKDPKIKLMKKILLQIKCSSILSDSVAVDRLLLLLLVISLASIMTFEEHHAIWCLSLRFESWLLGAVWPYISTTLKQLCFQLKLHCYFSLSFHQPCNISYFYLKPYVLKSATKLDHNKDPQRPCLWHWPILVDTQEGVTAGQANSSTAPKI